MARKRSILFSVNDRTSGFRYRTNLQRNVLGSEYLIKRLKCERVFVGHLGCVNTVAWNECGDILLSGSDDCKLNIYKLSSMTPLQSIQSGHQANIFSARFLPCTADTKIASCSGDGVLHYNDVNSHLSHGKNPFRCHTGTTYEINTTPGDPHTFMSSGEDGTVRLFDVRGKTKCLCEGCKEDVLIDCGKAVTSFSVNPVQPYYIAIGCENSLLRVYDRRVLSTGDPEKERDKDRGMLCQFKPKALEKQDRRVTSIKYSADGRNLLASYCSDYVYLFDSDPKTINGQSGAGMGHEEDGPCPEAGNDPPMKRLRLRGDWSDTGPNARPEGEEPETREESFVQRMSGYLTRWIEESLRNSRSQRRRDPNASRSRSEEDSEQTDDGTNSGSISEESRDEQATGTNTSSDVTDGKDDVTVEQNDLTENLSEVTNNDVIERGDDVTGNENDLTEKISCVTATNVDVTERNDVVRNKHDVTANPCDVTENRHDVTQIRDTHVRDTCSLRDKKSHSRAHDDVTRTDSRPERTINQIRKKNKCLPTTAHRQPDGNSDVLTNDNDEFRSQCDTLESREHKTSGDHDDDSCEDNREKMRISRDSCEKPGIQSDKHEPTEVDSTTQVNKPLRDISSEELLPTRSLDSEGNSDTQDSGIDVPLCNERIAVISTETQESETEHAESDRSEAQALDFSSKVLTPVINDDETDGVNVPEHSSGENVPSERDTSNFSNSSLPETSTPEAKTLGSHDRDSLLPESTTTLAPAESGPSEADSGINEGNVEESSDSDEDEDDPRRDEAASTIQNFFRLRLKKNLRSAPCNVFVHSEAKKIFKGHRNARTMIKEANFWGDDYILSGSDCGRIFIWSRKTTDVVMLLEGDRHVVNCVQPHPFFPMLATSGIDYDIKLWTPTALNATSMENVNEVIARNERMLRESRDTLTVPASFMIRVLSSLHRVRFQERGNTQSSGDSDSDLDDD